MSTEYWVARVVCSAVSVTPQIMMDVRRGNLFVSGGEVCEPVCDPFDDPERAMAEMARRARDGAPYKMVMSTDDL